MVASSLGEALLSSTPASSLAATLVPSIPHATSAYKLRILHKLGHCALPVDPVLQEAGPPV